MNQTHARHHLRQKGQRWSGPVGEAHPEGYLEAFANLYAGFAEAIRSRTDGREPSALGKNVPLAYDGLKGVAFVEAVVDSADSDTPVWLKPLAV
jgi:predicted dehydrogenase